MKTRQNSAPLRILALVLILAWVPQPDAKAWQLADLSEKELYKKYELAQKAGRLEEAYLALKTALEKRNSGRSKPKPHKKYTPLFEQLQKTLADREAAAGLAACRGRQLAACQERLRAAKAYAETSSTDELEAQLKRSIAGLQEQFDKVVASCREAASKVMYDDVKAAFGDLESLRAYAGYLPDVDSTLQTLKKEYFQRLIQEGRTQIANRNWDLAATAFQTAGELRPGLSEPQAGLDQVKAGKTADQYTSEAAGLLARQNFDEALRLVKKAEAIYPQGDFIATARQVIETAWVDFLAPQVPGLATGGTRFEDMRKASVCLSRIAELDPANPVLRYRPQVQSDFAYSSYDRGLDLAGRIPYMATAYTLLLNAQLRLPGGTVPVASLKSAASDFNRKRASQLLFSVENLSAAPDSFRNVVAALSSHTVESLALPDLLVRSLDQYADSPEEDPEFQDLLPDGKSSTCLLRVGISRHLSERWAVNVEEVKSGFLAGVEMVLNPDFDAKEKELVEFRRKMAGVKKEDQRRSLEQTYQFMLEQLKRIDRTMPRDKVVDYTYKRITYTQRTEIDLRISLSDVKTKEILFDDVITYREEQPADQVTGAHEKDVHGARDEEPLLPTPEQSLQKAQRQVLAALEEKIITILPLFTHRFFKEGQKLHDLGRNSEAAEQMLCHWAFFRGRLDDSEAGLTTRLILEETGFDVEKNGNDFLALVARTAPAVP